MSASAEQYSDDGVCGADEEYAVARAREVDREFVAGRWLPDQATTARDWLAMPVVS